MRKIFQLALLLFSVSAAALESPWLYGFQMTNLPVKMPASGTSNTVSSYALRPNRPAGIFISCVGTNNATNTLTLVFRGSIDNVASNSFPLITLTPSVLGTNWLRFYTNITLTVPFIHMTALTNGATGVTNLTVTLISER